MTSLDTTNSTESTRCKMRCVREGVSREALAETSNTAINRYFYTYMLVHNVWMFFLG